MSSDGVDVWVTRAKIYEQWIDEQENLIEWLREQIPAQTNPMVIGMLKRNLRAEHKGLDTYREHLKAAKRKAKP